MSIAWVGNTHEQRMPHTYMEKSTVVIQDVAVVTTTGLPPDLEARGLEV
jgi:hypothetical protein